MKMKVDREIVEQKLTEKFLERTLDKIQSDADSDKLFSLFDIPSGISSEYISRRRELLEADDFLLFAFTYIYYPNKLEDWFSEQEVKRYSKDKYVIEKADFPLRFKMIQVADDQFNGRITVKELMHLRDAQLINYNENAQRTMRHLVSKGKDIYQIMLNKKAVKDISESFKNDLYIPDTITLNIPDGASFYYDEDSYELVIKKLDFFDITDGYHRYIAMGKVHNEDPDWDHPMELRITNFSIDKANRFIWQEDQKTKMKKIQSDSMDTTRLANRIVNRLNTSTSFILNGKISRNNGIIDAAIFADVIDRIYAKGITKSKELKMMKIIQNEIAQNIEELSDINPDILDKRWDKKYTLAVVYHSKNGTMNQVEKTYQKLKGESHIYAHSQLTAADVTKLAKLIME